MADVKELNKKLNATAKSITLLAAEREEILEKNEEIDTIRQITVYEQKKEEFHELKNKILELKVEAEDYSCKCELGERWLRSLSKMLKHL